nr:hypothetical protein [Tanacetum cinerariifolium]
MSEGQAGPDPGNAGDEEQSIPSPVVHVGSDHEHMDLDVADVSPQPSTEQLDEGKHESGKYQPLPEVPGKGKAKVSEEQDAYDLLSLQKPKKKSPADQYILQRRIFEPAGSSLHDDSPYVVLGQLDSKEESKKVVLMATKGGNDEDQAGPDPEISALEINSLAINLRTPESPKVHQQFKATTTDTTTKQSTAEAIMPPPPPPPVGPSRTLGAPGASGSSQVPPPPPPPPSSTSQESPSKGFAAPSPSKTAASAEYQSWTTTDVRLRPSITLTPADLKIDEDIGPDEQAQLSNDEDIGSAHIPKVNLRQNWWKPLEEERPASPESAWSISSSDAPTDDMATFVDWFCKRRGIIELKPQDLESLAFEIIKVFHPDVIHLQYQMEEYHKLLSDSMDDPILRNNVSKPLPLGGPPGQVTIQSDFFFNKDLEYLRYGSKGSRPALSISKMKAAYYPNAALEQMVPDQFWIDEECKYDIAAMYGISYWWFQRQRFYINRHTSKGDRSAVRTHMRIFSVVRIEVFSMYGYDYMKKIVLRRTDLNEHVIAERDFKYMYPSD